MLKRFFKRLAIFIALLGALLFSIPFIVTLDDYRPILQQQLSQSLGRHVLIGDLIPQAMPLPTLTATKVTILGTAEQPGELFVETMKASLDPLALFNGRVVIRTIHLDGVGTNQRFIDNLIRGKSIKKGPRAEQHQSQETALTIHEISGSNVMLRTHDQTRLGPYRFTLFLGKQYKLKELYISRMDGTLRANIRPADHNSMALQVSADRWKMPVGPAFVFDRLKLQATLHNGSAELSSVEIEGYGGTLTTQGRLSWRNGWQYIGQVKTAAMQMYPPLLLCDVDTVKGRFYSDLNITLRGKSISQLFSNPELQGPFRITEGVVTKSASNHVLLTFDQLSGDGHLVDATLKTDNTVLKTAGGTIHGTTQLSWKKYWDIRGRVEASEIDSESFLAGFIDNKVVSGLFFATSEFHLSERDQQALLERPYLSGHFRIINGKIYKADLEKASTTLSNEGSHGGETPFQDLTGNARLENNHITITDLDITSDSMNAAGDININPQDELEGEIVVALRKTASIISAPLKVSGTIDDPSLRLSNDAIIGGAIGTSILGPGVGTAVGMKVGRIIKKIGAALSSGGEAKADLIPEK